MLFYKITLQNTLPNKKRVIASLGHGTTASETVSSGAFRRQERVINTGVSIKVRVPPYICPQTASRCTV